VHNCSMRTKKRGFGPALSLGQLIGGHRGARTANQPIRLFQNVGICRLFPSEEGEHHERCAT
jgi:hypothetical protein